MAENREKKKAKEQERKDEQYNQNILAWLDKYLTENRDRKLFGLPEFPVSNEKSL